MLATDIQQARSNMIAQQIRPWEVTDDRVLDAMRSLPREKFVPRDYAGLAYADIEIPLGFGETMLFPRIEAKILQALDIQPHQRILEIGTGSGYLTACLARLGGIVVSYEQHQALIDIARKNLGDLGIGNVRLENTDFFSTRLPAQSFDIIAVTGSLPKENPYLQQLLKTGGRMFLVLGKDPVMQAMRYTRMDETHTHRETLFETSLAPLNFPPEPPEFRF